MRTTRSRFSEASVPEILSVLWYRLGRAFAVIGWRYYLRYLASGIVLSWLMWLLLSKHHPVSNNTALMLIGNALLYPFARAFVHELTHFDRLFGKTVSATIVTQLLNLFIAFMLWELSPLITPLMLIYILYKTR